ncbi:DUF2207 domain-containing protein [Lentibacillus cibarius]|uniref:DUF2207 domain-containing protein n=1 Tax=Lentibacillus cibarius TaxID=2583219 RepID=A0A5S3QGA1_9BACI|nr:DUF2207 domain-containing protein [Lentibacillus cibarius]TMN20837.1 DUF2207 domain-containing protein [Lentibacillus cibarius]
MSNNKKYPWRFAIGGWGAFVVAAILFLIFDYDLYLMLGLLTAAIILTIGNAIYVFYTKRKSRAGEK